MDFFLVLVGIILAIYKIVEFIDPELARKWDEAGRQQIFRQQYEWYQNVGFIYDPYIYNRFKSPNRVGPTSTLGYFHTRVPGWCTEEEAVNYLGIDRNTLMNYSSGWRRQQVQGQTLYNKFDVENFAGALVRGLLLTTFGFTFQPIYTDAYDTECPVCHAFAVFNPGKSREEYLQILKSGHTDVICLNGHLVKT